MINVKWDENYAFGMSDISQMTFKIHDGEIF